MKNLKNIMMVGFVLLIVTLSKPVMALGLGSFTDVPNFSVVIGASMFTLDYANNPTNANQISAAIAENKGDIFIKTDDTGWIKNSDSTQVNQDAVDISTIKYNNGLEIVPAVSSIVTQIQVNPTITITGTNTATFTYKILDQTGLDITKTIPASEIYGSTSVGSIIVVDPTTGIGTITFNTPTDISTSVIVSLVDKNGVSGSSAPSRIAEFNINPITTKTGTCTTTFGYKVTDQTGEDITKTVPNSQLSATASDGSSIVLDPLTSTGTITYISSTDVDTSITITLTDKVTGLTISSEMVAPGGEMEAPKVGKIVENSTVLGVTPNGNGYASFSVYDQYGNDITNSSLGNEVTFTCNVAHVETNNSLITLIPNAGIDFTKLSSVVLTGSDSITGVSTTATVSIEN